MPGKNGSGVQITSASLGERVRRIFLPGNSRTYTAITVSTNPPTGVSGQPLTLSATVTPIAGGGVPTGTVKDRLVTARKQLRSLLERESMRLEEGTGQSS